MSSKEQLENEQIVDVITQGSTEVKVESTVPADKQIDSTLATLKKKHLPKDNKEDISIAELTEQDPPDEVTNCPLSTLTLGKKLSTKSSDFKNDVSKVECNDSKNNVFLGSNIGFKIRSENSPEFQKAQTTENKTDSLNLQQEQRIAGEESYSTSPSESDGLTNSAENINQDIHDDIQENEETEDIQEKEFQEIQEILNSEQENQSLLNNQEDQGEQEIEENQDDLEIEEIRDEQEIEENQDDQEIQEEMGNNPEDENEEFIHEASLKEVISETDLVREGEKSESQKVNSSEIFSGEESECETSTGKQEPVLLDETETEFLFGWSLLSPGVMEIKMNPDSDDPEDIIRIRRTPSLRCFLESGNLSKYQHLREHDKREKFFNESGNLEYTDILRMTEGLEEDEETDEEEEQKSFEEDSPSHTKNYTVMETEESNEKDKENTLILTAPIDNTIEIHPYSVSSKEYKAQSDVLKLDLTDSQKIPKSYSILEPQVDSTSQSKNESQYECINEKMQSKQESQNKISHKSKEKVEILDETKTVQVDDDGVDVLEGPKEMAFPTEKDEEMVVKYILPSESGVLPTKGKEDGEVVFASKLPDKGELEQAKTLTKESSMMSLQPKAEVVASTKKKKRDSSTKSEKTSTLKKLTKSKNTNQQETSPDSPSKKDSKKKRSWFRFWL